MGNQSSWIARPGKGKSALLTDIAVHGGQGKGWRGYRTPAPFGTVFFALERADLTKRRLIAYRRRDQLPESLPIAIASQVINLMDVTCVEIMHDAIQETQDHFGGEVGLVVIDTYAKAIAAGGGDESQAKDQNIAVTNLRRLLDAVPHVHIASIGHTGKDETKREARFECAGGRC